MQNRFESSIDPTWTWKAGGHRQVRIEHELLLNQLREQFGKAQGMYAFAFTDTQ